MWRSRYGDSGISVLTFAASLAYIQAGDPETFILEVVWKDTARRAFLKFIRDKCPNYAVWPGVINSRSTMRLTSAHQRLP